MSNTKIKNRIVSLDVLKTIAMFMVICYHLQGIADLNYHGQTFYFPNITKLFMNFCAMSVPLFFMVNGALMIGKQRTYRYFFRKGGKMIVLYLVWTCIIGGMACAFSGQRFLLVFTNRKSFDIISHLWFLRTLALLTFLAPFLTYLYEKKAWALKILCALLILYPFSYNYAVILGRYLHIPLFAALKRTGLFTSYSVVYYISGKYLTDHVKALKQKYFLTIGMLLLGWMLVTAEVVLWTNYQHHVFDGVNVSFPTIGALMMAIGTFCICIPSHIKANKILSFFSNNSMGVYILHMPIVFWIKSLGTVKNVNLFVLILLVFAVACLSALLTAGLKKIPGINYLFRL